MNNQILLSPIPMSDLLKEFEEIVARQVDRVVQIRTEAMFLSADEVCKMFVPKVSKTTLFKYTNEGLLKGYYIGGKLVYKYTEVIDMVTKVKKYARG